MRYPHQTTAQDSLHERTFKAHHDFNQLFEVPSGKGGLICLQGGHVGGMVVLFTFWHCNCKYTEGIFLDRDITIVSYIKHKQHDKHDNNIKSTGKGHSGCALFVWSRLRNTCLQLIRVDDAYRRKLEHVALNWGWNFSAINSWALTTPEFAKRKLFSKKMSKLFFGWQPHRQNSAFKYATASHKNTNVQKSLFWRWDIFWRSDGPSHTERHKPESQKFRQAQEETCNQKKSKKNVIRRQIKLSLGGSWYNNNNNR